MANFKIIFDDVMLSQLKQAGKNKQVKNILSKMLDRIEELGPVAGKLIDSHLHIYEIKSKHPPIRLYFKHIMGLDNIYVFEYELKTSEEKQRKTIFKIKRKARKSFG
ncbi:hypothetical protein HYU50_00570 [Candidatus Woesearchaeota archaeon]|nr:hypothetical protein [Candidatus Woesearchaeota archaeon]